MPFLAKEHHPVPTKDLLSWTFDDLAYDWDDPIYIDALNPKNNISARAARTAIRQLAAGFHAIGLQPGDCVCIHSFNDIWYPIFFLGVIAAGGVYAGTNPAYTAHELAHTMRVAKVKFILAQPDLLPPVLRAAAQAGVPDERVMLFNPHGPEDPSRTQWRDLLSHGERDWPRFDDLATARTTTAALLFSSGTTGLPKAAMLSHHNFIAQHTLLYEAPPRPYKAVRLCALPMFHAASAPVTHTTPLRGGEKMYVLPRFDLERWFWAHETYAVTDVAMVPPVVIQAINSPLRHKYDLRAAARAGQVGAAPLDKGPQARMQALLGGKPLNQVWGMTETSCVATRFRYPEYDATGSVGVPLPGLDLKLVDGEGRDVSAFGVRGELCVRGPTVIRGYFEDEEANRRDFDEEGFFHTGDVAFVERRSGLWYIVDRKKELIKVRGFQVAPPELEGVLLSHPDIVDAAVIGVPDPSREGDEVPRGYVVRRPGASGPSAEELHVYMRERLASYKMLEGGVRWVEAIPKNASGKILKRILREEAKSEGLAAKL